VTGANPRVAPDLIRQHAPELAEAITHLAFHAGRPAAMSATNVLASVTEATEATEATG
jgi:hypothetical protein